MWKREEAGKRGSGQSTPTGQTAPSHGSASRLPQSEAGQQDGRDVVNVGKSVVIKGELHGSENLTIEGQVEGKIKAQVFAKALVVLGAVNDNIAVSEKGDIRDGEAASATVRRVREAAPGVRSQLVQRVLRAECGGRREPRPSSATGCSSLSVILCL